MQGVALRILVIVIAYRQTGRSRLRIPVAKLSQIHATGVFHRHDKILAGDRLAIVPFKVQI